MARVTNYANMNYYDSLKMLTEHLCLPRTVLFLAREVNVRAAGRMSCDQIGKEMDIEVLMFLFLVVLLLLLLLCWCMFSYHFLWWSRSHFEANLILPYPIQEQLQEDWVFNGKQKCILDNPYQPLPSMESQAVNTGLMLT